MWTQTFKTTEIWLKKKKQQKTEKQDLPSSVLHSPKICPGMTFWQWWNQHKHGTIITHQKFWQIWSLAFLLLSSPLQQPLFSSAFIWFPTSSVNHSSPLHIVSFTLPTTQIHKCLPHFSLPTVPAIWSKAFIPQGKKKKKKKINLIRAFYSFSTEINLHCSRASQFLSEMLSFST